MGMLKKMLLTIGLLASFLITVQTVSAVTTGQVSYYGEESSTEASSTEASTTAHNEHAVTPTPPAKQSLLQTSDSVNYLFSLMGMILILIAVYDLRKNSKIKGN